LNITCRINVSDLKTNIDIRLTDWEQGGKVHRGFKEALDEIWPDLLPYIRKLQGKGCKIWITGHSLGGALATLCAGRYGKVQGVYTFGSPRVDDDAFKDNFDVKMYRFVYNYAIVSRVPSSRFRASSPLVTATAANPLCRSRCARTSPNKCSSSTISMTAGSMQTAFTHS
jgi:pimeloyl-ACP methyl ester carboxylesterase